jgi:hypothetical protein
MDSEHPYHGLLVPLFPPLAANELWRTVEPEERIECDHFHQCGREAAWATRHGNLHLCDYHRYRAEIERILAEIEQEKQGAAV